MVALTQETQKSLFVPVLFSLQDMDGTSLEWEPRDLLLEELGQKNKSNDFCQRRQAEEGHKEFFLLQGK